MALTSKDDGSCWRGVPVSMIGVDLHRQSSSPCRRGEGDESAGALALVTYTAGDLAMEIESAGALVSVQRSAANLHMAMLDLRGASPARAGEVARSVGYWGLPVLSHLWAGKCCVSGTECCCPHVFDVSR